jgi:hypothetical protein
VLRRGEEDKERKEEIREGKRKRKKEIEKERREKAK